LSLNYTYDAVGNALTIDSETFKYDWLNRLNYTSGGTGGWPTTTYTYDGAGNVQTKTVAGVQTTYSYNAYNRLASAGSVGFSYDANGNELTKVNGSTTWTYSYDYENRLVKVLEGSTTVSKDTYSGQGKLVETVEASTQVFAYQGSDIIYARNTGTGSIAKYYYGDGLLVATVNGSTMYSHEDALGSVRLTSSSSVTTLFSSDYRPYGLSYAQSGTIKQVFQYTGKPLDSATGLYNYGARFYDPSIGRFISEDSYMGSVTDPMSQNRYIYAEDNPMSFVDPSGNMIIRAGGGTVGTYQSPPPTPPPTENPFEASYASAFAPVIQQARQEANELYEENLGTITQNSYAAAYAPLIQQTKQETSDTSPVQVESPIVYTKGFNLGSLPSITCPTSPEGPANPVGAYLVTAATGVLSAGAAVAAWGFAEAALPSGGYTAPLAWSFGAASVSGFWGTGSELAYDWNAGAEASPEGAVYTGCNSAVVKFLVQVGGVLASL